MLDRSDIGPMDTAPRPREKQGRSQKELAKDLEYGLPFRTDARDTRHQIAMKVLPAVRA